MRAQILHELREHMRGLIHTSDDMPIREALGWLDLLQLARTPEQARRYGFESIQTVEQLRAAEDALTRFVSVFTPTASGRHETGDPSPVLRASRDAGVPQGAHRSPASPHRSPRQGGVTVHTVTGVTCPTCNAQPGQPCTAPTEHSRREVKWVHHARETASADQNETERHAKEAHA